MQTIFTARSVKSRMDTVSDALMMLASVGYSPINPHKGMALAYEASKDASGEIVLLTASEAREQLIDGSISLLTLWASETDDISITVSENDSGFSVELVSNSSFSLMFSKAVNVFVDQILEEGKKNDITGVAVVIQFD